jgi:hypothetical protein
VVAPQAGAAAAAQLLVVAAAEPHLTVFEMLVYCVMKKKKNGDGVGVSYGPCGGYSSSPEKSSHHSCV